MDWFWFHFLKRKKLIDIGFFGSWFFAEGVPSEQDLDNFLGRFSGHWTDWCYQSTSITKVYTDC